MIRSLSTFAILTALAVGQCNVTFSSYGAACGTAFPNATLTGAFDPATCTITLTLDAFPGCCNTFPTGNLWAFGLSQAQIPALGLPNCFILNSAELLVQTPTTQNVLQAVVPPSLGGLTLFAQGARTYFTTIGLTNDVTLTQGLQINF